MYFEFIYKNGKKFKIFPKIESLDQKLMLIEFPYTSAEIISGILVVLGVFFFAAALLYLIIPIVSLVLVFFGILIATTAYIYVTSIYYTQRIISFRDEMLQVILELSNYISLNTSMEAAVFYTSEVIPGTLGNQLKQIKEKIEKKEYLTLGEAFEEYMPLWLKINPEFVKGLNLLETASMSLPEVREEIINEVIDTVIQYYYDSGKKFTEKLSNKTKTLISVGVMLPMMSLILLPLITIFLPGILNMPILIFIYNIFFPAILLVLAFDFATNRIQVNTINIEHSPSYQKTPRIFYVFIVAILFFLSLPAVWHISTINLENTSTIAREYSTEAIINIWMCIFGIFLSAGLFSFFYYNRHEKLWNKAREIEEDIPHFISILATYLSLNRSIESTLDDIQEDYRRHGFPKHPTTDMLEKIKQLVFKTKMTLRDIMDKHVLALSPSMRMIATLKKIILFTEIDQKSAAKSARMIRTQTLSVYKLDLYIQTLLVETSSLVDITVKVMAPLLAVAATIMSVAIVMSLEFIKQQINSILASVGTASIDLQLVDITAIIPPTVLALIVGIYLAQTTLILSVFLSNINYGTDKVQIAKTVYSNLLTGFLIYTVLLFTSYYLFTELVFRGVLT